MLVYPDFFRTTSLIVSASIQPGALLFFSFPHATSSSSVLNSWKLCVVSKAKSKGMHGENVFYPLHCLHRHLDSQIANQSPQCYLVTIAPNVALHFVWDEFPTVFFTSLMEFWERFLSVLYCSHSLRFSLMWVLRTSSCVPVLSECSHEGVPLWLSFQQ